jgi:putative spermidine/putrescine transport system permease protein
VEQASLAAAQPARGAWRRHPWVIDALLLVPGLGYLLVFLTVPLVQVVLRSLGLLAVGEPSRLTLDFYREILSNSIYRDSIAFSLYFALATTVASLAAALVVSAVLRIAFPGRFLISVLYKIPLIVPSLVAAFLVLTLVDQGGIVARLLERMGTEWPEVVHDRWGVGIILVLVWHNVPIMIVILSAVIGTIPNDVLDAARNLGASPWRVFTTVIVPLALSGISAASLLVFIGVFGAFAIPSLVGAPYPQAVAVVMTTALLDRADWGLASALGTLVTAASAVILYIYYLLIRRQEAAVR